VVQFCEAGAFMNKPKRKTELGGDLHLITVTLNALENRIAVLKQQAVVTNKAPPNALDEAKRHYKARRARSNLFGVPDLFGEPAWDMLVDLFIAAEEGKRISVSSLCIASGVPMTTALRWISILEGRELVSRTADPFDARRFYISLSSETRAKIKAHFEKG
jgi:uncharacterized small protein (DUF1192 family)